MSPTFPTEAQFLLDIDEVLEQPRGTNALANELASIEGWDSMAVLNLMAMADDKYGISLKPSELIKCVTLADVYRLLLE